MINYYLLTKPGILLGNLVTLAAGFFLASKSGFDLALFLATFIGLGFIMASSCVLNNDINSESDKKMERTKDRALAKGIIARESALIFAVLLGIIGFVVLYAATNPLTVMVAGLGFLFMFFFIVFGNVTQSTEQP